MTCIDSHTHLYLDDFHADLQQVIQHALSAGVEYMLFPNIDSSTIEPMLNVCRTYPNNCFPMIGLHPTSVKADYRKELLRVGQELSADNPYIAIGEIGLDLYWDKTYLSEQLSAFDQQIRWALQYDLPVVIHCRDAFETLHHAMQPYLHSGLCGVFHSFTGTVEEATALLRFEGFKIGINGVVTFKNSQLAEVLTHIPLSRVLIETDAPYLTPVPYRGKRNESAYIIYVLDKLSEIYKLPVATIANNTLNNAFEVFRKLKSAVRD